MQLAHHRQHLNMVGTRSGQPSRQERSWRLQADLTRLSVSDNFMKKHDRTQSHYRSHLPPLQDSMVRHVQLGNRNTQGKRKQDTAEGTTQGGTYSMQPTSTPRWRPSLVLKEADEGAAGGWARVEPASSARAHCREREKGEGGEKEKGSR